MPQCRACRASYRQELHARAKVEPGASKTCRRCQETLPIEQFTNDRRSRDGKVAQCRSCRAARRKDADPQVARSRMLRWKYGISEADYAAMFERQEGACESCGAVPSGRLHVDHDHETGVVRALLCHPCNTALGLLAEDVVRIENLARYIARFQSLTQA